jgi:hypothetical protein
MSTIKRKITPSSEEMIDNYLGDAELHEKNGEF